MNEKLRAQVVFLSSCEPGALANLLPPGQPVVFPGEGAGAMFGQKGTNG